MACDEFDVLQLLTMKETVVLAETYFCNYYKITVLWVLIFFFVLPTVTFLMHRDPGYSFFF